MTELTVVMEDHGSTNIDVEALEQRMKAKLRSDSPLSAQCCIFRVPELLRKHKPEASDVVSIGPFHHSSSKLFANMKDVKQWYLNSLLLRKNISLKALIQGIDSITWFEKRARDYYAESFNHLDQNQFIEMMIIDGCFLLELFQRRSNIFPDSDKVNVLNDPLSNMGCMIQYLCHDLLLLENQLPWFVLESLYNLTCYERGSLTRLVLNFFISGLSSLAHNCNGYRNHSHDNEILHILDLIRSAILVAGLMTIDFKDGVLTIPQLAIADINEPLFRNRIAFEQCYHGRDYKVTSYASLMDNLIASSKDVVFLSDNEIIRNWLSAEDASQVFSKLVNDTLIVDFCYGRLCAAVNKYYKVRWNQWLARLKRDYLSNPWKITSLVAAFILLVLTLLQTTYTIQQYYSPPK
ncbi:UPF0481 protein At3g47200 [Rosa chinensis]|uniref:UPF0481 protein At3g47200 n=1 Tax=Rosa chinensis TaxID=74649 RepID=UPI001AD8FD8D|nr:UPF0481 protein At3g47200 [Rosa chinensis]